MSRSVSRISSDAAEAFGDVLAGQLDVDPARPGALRPVGVDEPCDLADDVLEVAGLSTAGSSVGVGMHRVAGPDHRVPGVAHGLEQRAERFLDVLVAHPRDQRQPTGDPRRIERLAQLEDVVGGRRRPDLAADRVVDPAEELDVRPVELAGALADPEHVRRAVVPTAGQRVLAGERFLVAEQERLVAGVDVGLVEGRGVLRVDAAGAHEPQGAIDLAGEPVVALPFEAGGDELLRPGMHPGEVGEPALGERPDQVERRCRLVVGLHQAIGVGSPGSRGGRRGVDDVPAEAGQVEIADPLER